MSPLAFTWVAFRARQRIQNPLYLAIYANQILPCLLAFLLVDCSKTNLKAAIWSTLLERETEQHFPSREFNYPE